MPNADTTMPLLAVALDKERNEHQATLCSLDAAITRAEDAEVDAALMKAIALQALATFTAGPQSLEAIVTGVNRQLARELIEERRARHRRPAFDSAARAIAGQSAADLNAALGLEVREHPNDFDPAGGHP